MKITRITTLLAALAAALLIIPTESQAQNVGEMYKQARAAFTRGDLDTAATLLDQVIKAQPSYVPARALQAQVQQQLASRGGGEALEKKCASVIIPKIDYNDVELKLALEALAIMASEATGGKFRPNFILNGGDEVGARKVTLQLRGAPLTAVLEYLGKITNVTFRYERFAVVGVPQAAASAPAPASEPEATVPAAAPLDPFAKKR